MDECNNNKVIEYVDNIFKMAACYKKWMLK
jgi:hypothetical protein